MLYLFLKDWLILFNSCSYYANSNPIAELVIPIGILTKEAKAEIETHVVIVEVTISKWSV